MIRLLVKTFILSSIALAICAPARAGNSGITYHARIIKPDETALEGKEVQFRLQIRSPGTENCLLYEEMQTHDLRNSGGVIAITINDGTGTRLDGGSYNIDQIFANRAPFTMPSSKCETGTGTTMWTPNPSDGRRFQVMFREDSSRQWEPLPSAQMNFVPMAIESKQVGGFAATNLLRVADGTGPAIAPILSPVQATELVALTNGSSTLYTKAGQLNGFALPVSLSANESIRWNGTGWETFTPAAMGAETDPTVKAFAKANLPTCGAGQVLVSDGTSLTCVTDATGTSPGDATTSTKGLVVINSTGGLAVAGGTLSLAASGVTAGTYTKVTVDNAGRVTSGASFVAADIPALDASKITSGTITMPVVTSGAVSATSLSSKSIYVWDSDNTNSVEIVAPATGSFTSNYVLTLPTTDGSAGEVLQTDGAGNLSWVAASSGSVTNVGLTLPSIFSVVGGPITTNGTFSATLASQTQNTFFASPNGSNGAPSFRAMVAADVPALDASKVTTGTFAQSQIPALAAAQIPNLDASKITTGTLAIGRIPALDASNVATGTFATSQIPSLDASKTTTGTFASALIPDLDASKIATGTISAARLPSQSMLWSANGADVFRVSGNVGIGTTAPSTKLDVAGAITANAQGTAANQGGEVRFQELAANGVNYAALRVPDALAATYTLTLPVDDGTSGQILSTDGNGALSWVPAGGTGTVTNVGLALPAIFSVAGGPITTNGTFTATLASQTQNTFFAAPDGSSGAPTFRAMVAADVPALDASKITTGTLSAGVIPDLDAAKITSGTLAVARIPDLDAAKTTSGTFAGARIPALDASKITTGTFASSLIPALGAAQIPNLDASKVTTGTFSPALIPDLDAAKITSGTLAIGRIPALDASNVVTGTFAASQIPTLDASKVGTGTFASAQIPSLDAGKITTGTFTAAQIPSLDASKISTGTITNTVNNTSFVGTRSVQVFDSDSTNKVTIQTPATGTLTSDYVLTLPADDGTNGQILTTDGNGVLSWVAAGGAGTVTNVGLTLPSIFSVAGGPITTNGTFTATLASQTQNTFWAAPNGSSGAPTFRAMVAADVPALDAAKISTGTFAQSLIPALGAAQIPNLDASKITTGTFAPALIPDLDAAKITTGTLNAARIPDLDAAKTTSGTFAVARIPALDAAQITTGTFASSLIPALGAAQIPNLDASKITTGTFTTALIPDLDAAKIASGTLAVARIPALDAAKITTGTFAAAQIPTLDASKIATGTITSTVNNTTFVGTRSVQVFDSDSTNKVTLQTPATGTLTSDYVLTLPADDGTNGQILTTDGNGVLSWTAAGGSGTVTNVGLTLPSIFSVTGGPVTTNGTFTATLASQTQNRFFASPDGSSGTPTFRAMVAADVPSLDAGKVTTGTFAVAQIPTLDAAKIGTGTFAAAQIPGLDAAKIVSGTFTSSQIPALDASKTTTGTFASALIPSLDAGKITTGTLSVPVNTTGMVGTRSLQVFDSDSTNKVTLVTPATGTLTSDYVLTLPADDGTSNQVLTTDGSGGLSWTTPAAPTSGTFRANDGTAAIPTFSFLNDTNTGLYLNGTDMLGFSTGGSHRMTLNASGYLGIGTTLPTNVLHVIGGATFEGGRVNAAPSGGGAVMFTQGNFGYFATNTASVGVRIRSNDMTNDTEGLTVISGGNVGVGTTGPGTKFDVAGVITANAQGTLANQGGEMRFQELAVNGSHYAALRVPDALAANYTLTLPVDDGANGQILTTDGNGVLSWAAAGGAGTVTNVGLALPNIFSVTGGPVTTNGTFTATLASQTQNTFWAAPNGSSGAPTFRAMVAADVPALDAAKITTGTFTSPQIPDLDSAKITTGTLNVARIPDLDAAKTTSGTFAVARIPALDAAKITTGTFATAQIPALDASKTTSGTFASSLIPDLDASKIATGTINSARLPAQALAWSVSGNDIYRSTGGSVAVGTSVPRATFHVDSNANPQLIVSNTTNSQATVAEIGFFYNAGHPNSRIANISAFTQPGGGGDLRIQTASSGTAAFDTRMIVTRAGDVGIGLTGPSTMLDVGGVITANAQGTAANQGGEVRFRELSGNGSHYAALRVPDALAANYTLTLPVDDGTNGQILTTDGNGVLSWAAAGGSGTVTNVGLALPNIFSVTGGPVTTNGTFTATLASQTQNRFFASPDGSSGTPTFRAMVAADVPALDAAKITSGTFAAVQIPALDAAKITTGSFAVARIPDLDASKTVSGTFATSLIPALDAAKITTGSFNVARIPDLDAAKITTGSFALARIPDFDASKTVSGTFETARIPDLDTAKITTGSFNVARIPDLDSAKIATGTIATARIPALDAAKITTGTITIPVNTTGTVGTRSLQVFDSDSTNKVTIVTPATGSLTADYTLTLPVDDGTSNQVLTTNGSGTLSWTTPSGASTGTFLANSGTAPVPTFSFSGDPNTGMYNVTSDVLGFSTNGTERVRIDSTGNVGIGGTSSADVLYVTETKTTTATGWDQTIFGLTKANPVSPSSAQIINGYFSAEFEGATNSPSAEVIGVIGDATSRGTGTLGKASSFVGAVFSQAGLTNAGRSFEGQLEVNNGSTVIDYRGLSVGAYVNSGTLQGATGVFIDDLPGSLYQYGIYQVGSTDKNYFNGSIGIGTTNPATKLDVQGTIKLGTGTCGASTQGSLQFSGGNIQFCNTSNAWTTLSAGGSGDVVRGGNTQSSGTMVIGTNDAYPLALETSGSVRMLFDTNGSAGMGANAGDPTIALGYNTATRTFSVTGDGTGVNSYGNVVVANSNGSVGGYEKLGNFDFAHSQNLGNKLVARITASTNGNSTVNGYGGEIAFHTKDDNATTVSEKMRILSTGNIGIGTTNPATKLDVNGSIKLGTGTCGASTQGSLQFSGGNIQFCNTSNAWTTLSAGGSGDVVRGGNTQSSGTMIVGTNDAYPLALETNGTNRLMIDSIGNVAIGTASPGSYRMLISGSANTNILGVTDGTSTAAVYAYGAAQNSVQFGSVSNGNVGFFTNNGTPSMSLNTNGGLIVGTYANQATYAVGPANGLAVSGNVGIGTTAPRGGLDVQNGSIVGKASTSNGALAIDFANGNIQHTTANCGAVTLNNLKDGGTYMFIVKGTGVATCSFTAYSGSGTTGPLTVHLPPDHGATTSGKHTIYNIAVSGGDVYFAWTPGY